MATVEIDIVGRDSFSGVLGNFGSIMTGIESTINLIKGAFDAAVNAITPFVNSAAESEVTITKLEAVLRATQGAAGLTSQELQNMANELQGVTRFSDETILTGASLMLTFRNIGEETMQRAIPAMLDMAEIFGSVDSAAMQLGKALNDPVNMMGALSRAGVTFTDAQKEMIKSLVESGDLLGAQNIILSELEMQVGGVAEAVGGTFTGQWEIAKNKLDEVRELIGGPIISVFADLLGKLNEFVDSNPAIQGFMDFMGHFNTLLQDGVPFLQALGMTFKDIGENSDWISNSNLFLKELGIVLLDMQSVLDNGGTVFDAIATAAGRLAAGDGPLSQIAGFVSEIMTAFETGGAGAAMDTFVAGIFDSMAESINAWVAGSGPQELSAALISWIDNIGTGAETDSKMLVAARNLIAAIGRALGNVDWNGIATAIDEKLAAAIGAHDWSVSGASFGSMLDRFISGNISLDDQDSLAIPAITDALNRWLLGAVGAVSWEQWRQAASANIAAIFTGLFDTLVDTFYERLDAVKSAWRQIGLDIIAGLGAGLSFENMRTNISTFVNNMIAYVKTLFGISSPSTVFYSIGVNIVQGLINGLSSMWGSLVTWLTTRFNNLLETFSLDNIFDGLTAGGTGGASGSVSGIGTQTSPTTSTLTSGSVVNNFYAPVYFGDMGQLGYDCPSPHPLLTATAGGVGGF